MVRVDPDTAVEKRGVDNTSHVRCEGEHGDAVVVARATEGWATVVELQVAIVVDSRSGGLEEVVHEAEEVGEEEAEERWGEEEVCSQCRFERRSRIFVAEGEFAFLDPLQCWSCGEDQECQGKSCCDDVECKDRLD